VSGYSTLPNFLHGDRTLLRFNDAERTLDLSVHDVVDAGPPAGHLTLSAGWSGRMRMAAGQQVHSTYQSFRTHMDPGFVKEAQVRHKLLVRDWEVSITGRMDGLCQEGDHWIVEEVKSSALGYDRLEKMTVDDLPRAVLQLRMYLHALAGQGKAAIGRLVLISMKDGTQHLIHVAPDPTFGAFIERQVDWMLSQHEVQVAWRNRRRSVTIPEPHEEWRKGQDELAIEVEEAVDREAHLMLTAPTGLGKTAAVLYGALRSAYRTDRRIFFATARTTQQKIVEETVAELARKGLPVRAVSIRAREKACLNEVVACRPDCCEYANGHHDRTRTAGVHDQLWQENDGVMCVPTPDDVQLLAKEHTICPFAVSMDLAAQADVIIGDYNYFFDPSRRLSSVADSPDDWIVIVDDRARSYASPSLSSSLVSKAIEGLETLHAYDAITEIIREVEEFLQAGIDTLLGADEAAFPIEDGLELRRVQKLAGLIDAVGMDYALLKSEHRVFEEGDLFTEIARQLTRIRLVLERAGDETVVIWKGKSRRGAGGLRLLCRDPAPLLRPLFAEVGASVVMSATLQPIEFYGSMFGLDAERRIEAQYESPFPPQNRRVLVVPDVSTEFKKREKDKTAIAAHVEATIQAVPGNVAVYFSSFALRDMICAEMGLIGRPVIFQERNMDEHDRAVVLETMARGEGHVLMGVLGGIFAEGIDLPGSGLLAAIIVGPALPAVGLERRLMSAWFQEQYEHGFRYAYQVPGMARVVQAAGRVIRTPKDEGAIILIDRRFLQNDYQRFFPASWFPIRTNDPSSELNDLWTEQVVTESGCES
jgi:DNA excision repair protein ERCC-2